MYSFPPKVVAASLPTQSTDGSVLEGFILRGSYSWCDGDEHGGGTVGWLKPAGHTGTSSGLDFILIVRGDTLSYNPVDSHALQFRLQCK